MLYCVHRLEIWIIISICSSSRVHCYLQLAIHLRMRRINNVKTMQFEIFPSVFFSTFDKE